MIRDQANKTLNVYLDRVRKYDISLPDSVLPPPENAAPTVPRMSTPQGGNSWTGWAVSSFTNKLGTATGEMQTANGVKPGLERSASTPPSNGVPQPTSTNRPSPASIAAPSVPSITKAPSNLRNSTPAPEDEDFGDGWGDLEDDPADAWADAETRQTSTDTSRPNTAAFDDQGEPDFEGWLSAQAQAKSNPSRPLPKGLTKKAAPVRPAVPARSSAPQITAATKPAQKPTAAQAAASKPATKPAARDDDEDWGAAWG